MKMFLPMCLVIVTAVEFSLGGSAVVFKEPSRCGDWLPYNDEKCIKIAYKAGLQTQEDGMVVCETLSAELNREFHPKVITVKTEEEQLFLQRFLFAQNNIMDDVWLGLKDTKTLGEYEWNDGGKVSYNNWAAQNVTDRDHRCVVMASGKGRDEEGLWVKVHCEKRNVVACERPQSWSLATLQDMVLNQKLELQLQQTKIHHLEEKNSAFEQKLHALEVKYEVALEQKADNVPIGFIYIQYPNQTSPADLWPFANWTDVSASYAGLFFRVVGGRAAAFGDLQEANTTRLLDVERVINIERNTLKATLPPDGTWSELLHSGWVNGNRPLISMRFRLSAGEVRPKNTAVIIWQRVQ